MARKAQLNLINALIAAFLGSNQNAQPMPMPHASLGAPVAPPPGQKVNIPPTPPQLQHGPMGSPFSSIRPQQLPPNPGQPTATLITDPGPAFGPGPSHAPMPGGRAGNRRAGLLNWMTGRR